VQQRSKSEQMEQTSKTRSPGVEKRAKEWGLPWRDHNVNASSRSALTAKGAV
jgi:hypothetical protein